MATRRIKYNVINGQFTAEMTFVSGDAIVSLTFDDIDDVPYFDIAHRKYYDISNTEFGRLNTGLGVDLLKAMRSAVRWLEKNGIKKTICYAAGDGLMDKYKKLADKYRGPVEFRILPF